jgi:hypothetical protein
VHDTYGPVGIWDLDILSLFRLMNTILLDLHDVTHPPHHVWFDLLFYVQLYL